MGTIKSYFSSVMPKDAHKVLTPTQRALRYVASHVRLTNKLDDKHISRLSLDKMDELQSITGLMLIPVEATLSSINKLSLFPVLIRLKAQSELLVYDPVSQRLRSTVDLGMSVSQQSLGEFQLEAAWQCIPASLPIFTSLTSMLRGMWKFMRPDLASAWFSIKLTSLMTLLTPLMSGYLFNHFQILQAQHNTIIYLCFLLIFCSVNFAVFNNELKLKTMNTKWLAMSLPAVWRHLLSLPLRDLQQYQSGSLAQLLFDYETAMGNLPGIILSLLTLVISLLSLFIYMLYCQPVLALIFSMICLAALGCKLYFMPQQTAVMNNMLAAQSTLSQFTTEMLMQIHKIRSIGAESVIYQRWVSHVIKTQAHAETSMRINLKIVMLDSALPLSMMIGIFLVMYAYPASIDTYLLLQFMLCAGQFYQLFEKLALQINSMMQVSPALKRMQPFTESIIEAYDINKRKPSSLQGAIEFKQVSLRMPQSKQFILEDVSLSIPAGKMVAITGRTGAGKTSLLRLLLGFESPEHGEIKIDNIPLQQWNSRDVRQTMGVVLQSSQIFPGTIYSNIALNHAITHHQAWELAQQVNLDQDIAHMPMKMHTIISDHAGESLSGGQKQKILLARALAGKPGILLLDEATSALDNTSQAHINRHLQRLAITRLVVAHRYSTIASADWIIVLDQGHIVDQGCYQDLLMRGHFQL